MTILARLSASLPSYITLAYAPPSEEFTTRPAGILELGVFASAGFVRTLTSVFIAIEPWPVMVIFMPRLIVSFFNRPLARFSTTLPLAVAFSTAHHPR